MFRKYVRIFFVNLLTNTCLFYIIQSERKFGTNIRTSKNGNNFNSNERIGKWSVIRRIKGEFDYEDRKIIQGK